MPANQDVSHLVGQEGGWSPRQWVAPEASSPMGQLIAMGFANRELNTHLLEKHRGDVQAVVNALLSRQQCQPWTDECTV